ncbi:MAG: peptidoglycan-binding protein, partial [Halomonadaceae bacterium]
MLCLLLPLSSMASEDLRLRFDALDSGFPLMAADQPLAATEPLQRFYRANGFKLAWWQQGRLSDQAQELLDAMVKAVEQGLMPVDYHYPLLRARMATETLAMSERAQVDLELLLSDGFILLAAHLSEGKVNPETIDPEWHAQRHGEDLEHLLASALAEQSVGNHLAALSPVHPEFRALKQARQHMARLTSEPWPNLRSSTLVRPGQESELMPALRHRLILLEDLARDDVDSEASQSSSTYDQQLAAALARFQARHGLEADGIIGPATLAALNVTPFQRVHQLDVNLERWRWLPRHLGDRYVLVNIAGFRLQYIENGAQVMEQRVIVGRDYRRTPVFSDHIRYLEFSPTWTVPPSLAVRDQLPQIRKDPDYLQRLGFKVYNGWGAGRETVDPHSVDWQSLTARNFPYRLVQQPGPSNALGQVKFMFPNRFNVYLHDTPSRDLFRQADRAFSSGCVRIENPMDLAQALLAGDSDWTRPRIDDLVASGRTRAVNLRHPVPVHIQYWTAWADEQGQLQLRKDLYNRDGP